MHTIDLIHERTEFDAIFLLLSIFNFFMTYIIFRKSADMVRGRWSILKNFIT